MLPRRNERLAYIGGVVLVARRDLRSLLRSPWAFDIAAVIVLLVGLGAIAGLPRGATTSTAVSDYAQWGYSLYRRYLDAIALIVLPAIVILAVGTERKQNTLDQLRISCLSNGQIIFGKTAAALFLYLLFCAATLPIAGMVYFFAGVDLNTMLLMPFNLAPFAILCASIGIASGFHKRETFGAWWNTLGTVFALLTTVYVSRIFFYLLFPMPALAHSIFVVICFLFCSAIALLHARRGLRVYERQSPDTQHALPAPTSFVYYPPTPIKDHGPRELKDGTNPMFVKEQWTSAYCAGQYTGIIAIIGILFGMFSTLGLLLGGGATPFALYTRPQELLLMLAIIPILVVQLINRERDAETFILLRTSLLHAHDVLWGKIYALLHSTVPFFFSVLSFEIVIGFSFGLFGDTNPVVVMIAALILSPIRLPLYFVFVACCTLPGALLARTQINTMIMGYGTAALGYVVVELLRRPLGAWLWFYTQNPRSTTTQLVVFTLDLALMTLFAALAFKIACRLYDHPRLTAQ